MSQPHLCDPKQAILETLGHKNISVYLPDTLTCFTT
jgi:hypothetical protein